MTKSTLLEVVDLAVSYRQEAGWQPVLHKINFAINRGETFGLVGESGCGKSTVALQLLGYRHPASRVDSGEVRFRGQNLTTLRRSELARLRGNRISFVPQNPTTALNPGIRVGAQVAEELLSHQKCETQAAALRRVVELLSLVGLPHPNEAVHRFPHQLSGGQQQRVCIAMALACGPDLVVLDEPTTGLDVTTQAQIIDLLVDLRTRVGMSMLYVTHDLGVLAQVADRIGVMYAGHMVEVAPTEALFGWPRHPYTRGLIASVPRLDSPGEVAARPLRGMLKRAELPTGCPFQPRCDFAEPVCALQVQVLRRAAPHHEVACHRWDVLPVHETAEKVSSMPVRSAVTPQTLLTLDNVSLGYGSSRRWLRRGGRRPAFVAVSGLSFSIADGETLALVGESGSGKSTVARAISGLLAPIAGAIMLKGKSIGHLVQERSNEERRTIQYVFQNPDASLNPRAKVGTILARPLQFFFHLDPGNTRARVAGALADTRLDASYSRRFPDQLSGGERQRVAIARALISDPEMLICDEVLSALDVSVQASILELIRRLKERHRVAILFIAHDLAVVRQIADRVAVMYQGQLMEIGNTVDIFAAPYHPYTYALLSAVPNPGKFGAKPRHNRLPPRTSKGQQACAFAGRCPWQVGSICEEVDPPWRHGSNGLSIRSHVSLAELTQLATQSR